MLAAEMVQISPTGGGLLPSPVHEPVPACPLPDLHVTTRRVARITPTGSPGCHTLKPLHPSRQQWGGTDSASPLHNHPEPAASCVPGVDPHPKSWNPCTEKAAAPAPGIPRVDGEVPLMEVACAYAAACDVAVADARFRVNMDAEGVTVMHSLGGMCQLLAMEFRSDPKADCARALLDFQFARVLASSQEVGEIKFDYMDCFFSLIARLSSSQAIPAMGGDEHLVISVPVAAIRAAVGVQALTHFLLIKCACSSSGCGRPSVHARPAPTSALRRGDGKRQDSG